MKVTPGFIPEDDPRELAASRWQMVEAFNGAEGLTPMARRLGIALVAKMDARDRVCFPSEARLAAELRTSRAAIQRAKAELRDAGFIDWAVTGWRAGKQCFYQFNTIDLREVHEELKRLGDAAVEQRASTKPRHGGFVSGSNNSTKPHQRGFVVDQVEPTKPQTSGYKAPNKPDKASSSALQSLTSGAVSSQYLLTKNCSLDHAASCASPDGAEARVIEVEPVRFHHSVPVERPEAPKKVKGAGAGCPFPKLWQAFESHPQRVGIETRLAAMTHDNLTKASAALAKSGPNAALKVIWPC